MHRDGLPFQDGAEHAQCSLVARPSNKVGEKPAEIKFMIFRIGVDRVRNVELDSVLRKKTVDHQAKTAIINCKISVS
jgi:hypothetical protein